MNKDKHTQLFFHFPDIFASFAPGASFFVEAPEAMNVMRDDPGFCWSTLGTGAGYFIGGIGFCFDSLYCA